MLKVQVISREIIKPSSPTPHDLASYKLTLIDQTQPSKYVSILLFYSSPEGDSIGRIEKTHQLKKSLSETLTQYYPLAGRIKEGTSMVVCNDEGAEFSEARVDGQLSEFLKRPYVEILDRMAPCNPENAKSGNDILVATQLNCFDCGGMALAVCIHHNIADAASLGTFINGWASRSRGIFEVTGPKFHSSVYFPTEGPIHSLNFVKEDNVVMKRFVFDAPKIETLRTGPSIDSQMGRPTRIEAISALIWRCMIRTAGAMRTSFAIHSVNLRQRMSPLMPENSFGNLVFLVVAKRACQEDMQSCLEQKLRNAIRGVDNSIINELQKTNGISKAYESMFSQIAKYIDSGVDVMSFSSWCRLPFYEADFGWGKPVWISTCTFSCKNLVLFTSTSGGDGIEAWVNMADVEMAKFEQDQELLCFVSPPSAA